MGFTLYPKALKKVVEQPHLTILASLARKYLFSPQNFLNSSLTFHTLDQICKLLRCKLLTLPERLSQMYMLQLDAVA